MAKVSPIIAYAAVKDGVVLPDSIMTSRKMARELKQPGETLVKVRISVIEGKV
jgi:hypothetical protein